MIVLSGTTEIAAWDPLTSLLSDPKARTKKLPSAIAGNQRRMNFRNRALREKA